MLRSHYIDSTTKSGSISGTITNTTFGKTTRIGKWKIEWQLGAIF
jgi:hypothetical protein